MGRLWELWGYGTGGIYGEQTALGVKARDLVGQSVCAWA